MNVTPMRPMRMFDEVAIVTDRTNVGLAEAVRGVLEGFDLHVHFYQLVQRRQAVELFGSGGPPCDWTVLIAHGVRADNATAIRFDVRDNPSDDSRAIEGWFLTTLDLAPANIPSIVKNPHGVYITNACLGGDPLLAKAFLDAGCEAYIGSLAGHQDTDSGTVFLISLFYFLLTGDRDFSPREYSLEEAVERAREVHGDWEHGTAGFRCYTRASITTE